MKIKPHDRSPCRWSVQEQGACPYRELVNMILNDVSGRKSRCEGKQCLQLVPNIQNEEELIAKAGRADYLKPSGPANTVELLSNVNIDKVLKDFSLASIRPERNGAFKNGPFYHIAFDMRDFMKAARSELRDINFRKMHEEGFRTFGCVLNTDVWAGPGEHWVCIFGNLLASQDDKNGNLLASQDDNLKITVEYFNSSGNGLDMFPELNQWVQYKREGDRLSATSEREGNINITIKEVSGVELQKSETECGMWCLCYIKSRLEGHEPQYFIKSRVTDPDITNMRKYIFSN